VERDVSGEVVQKKMKTSVLKDQKTYLFVVTEDLYEDSAEIPTKEKHEGDDTPKMKGKTQRSEQCAYHDGGVIVGVVLDDVVVGPRT
jgi:hypothetical protein